MSGAQGGRSSATRTALRECRRRWGVEMDQPVIEIWHTSTGRNST